ncbi:MAG TPA: hypothetical protein VMD03_06015 [Steroidobacteraceae bacterium]|nr:hypothetical protein [Steroidobacteraceae bacterium]
MSRESLRAAHATERRPAVWPWVVMPLAALAMFFVLRSVRHSADNGRLATPASPVADDSGDASGP